MIRVTRRRPWYERVPWRFWGVMAGIVVVGGAVGGTTSWVLTRQVPSTPEMTIEYLFGDCPADKGFVAVLKLVKFAPNSLVDAQVSGRGTDCEGSRLEGEWRIRGWARTNADGVAQALIALPARGNYRVCLSSAARANLPWLTQGACTQITY